MAVMAGLGAALGAMAIDVITPITAAETQTVSPSTSGNHHARTPIKHLIVVIGENRGFDNVFATYVPPDPKQSVWNLLSLGIIDKTGAPGFNAAKALQRQATDQDTFRLAPSITGAFPTLPQPSTTLSAIPYSPCDLSTLLSFAGKNPAAYSFCSDIGLLAADQPLLSTGGTGQSFYFPPLYPVPDCRYPSNLPNAPYSLVGASVNPSNCQPLPSPFPPNPAGSRRLFSATTPAIPCIDSSRCGSKTIAASLRDLL